MALGIVAILDTLQSHAAASGYFDGPVGTHEPKQAPGNGLSCAIWVQSIGPTPGSSGLAATSGRIELNVRLFTSMLQEPQDAIDTNLLLAVDALLAAYSGDFELGGNVRAVDLLGEAGTALSAKAGYLNQDGKEFRVMTIVLPVLINDIWGQAA